MKISTPKLAVALLLAAATLQSEAQAQDFRPLVYEITATAARLNRKVLGPVTEWVDGVAAQPVDSFCWNGEGSVPIKGRLVARIDPVAESGTIEVQWTDENGTWTYFQEQFIHPEHFSGIRIGNSSVLPPIDILNEGVTQNVYLHGDTRAGMPVLPTVYTHLATWGPADVTRDGRPFENPYEIPNPQWIGHLMVTEGVRNPDGTVRTITGEIYNPDHGAEGAIDPNDLEVHLVFHDERFPPVSNIPPIFQFFYHLLFENVSIRIVQADVPPGFEIEHGVDPRGSRRTGRRPPP